MLFVLILAAVAIYLLVRMAQERRGPSAAPRRRPQPPRIVAPDDDEDFLRDLDRKRRRKHRDPEDGQE